MKDIIIIGAGPAGLSAAIYAVRAGHSVTVLEEFAYGGQIINTPEVENYPAVSTISGFEFSQNLYDQATALGAEVLYEKAEAIRDDGNIKVVVTGAGEHRAKAVIIANGAKHRKLGVPGEDAFAGKGVSYCATCDGAFYKGKDVCIVGGGNTALEDALFLANNCKTVYLIHRRDAFRASKVTVDSVLARENIRVVYDSVVDAVLGDRTVTGVAVSNVKTGRRPRFPFRAFSSRLGCNLKTRRSPAQWSSVRRLYCCGRGLQNLRNGIFVAGDTRSKAVRQLVTAASDGAVAAIEASNYINQSFIG
ncbi:MAG: NAD(P)/FAD-dependent oxidoreductase [Oscillospiraceae bacterium]